MSDAADWDRGRFPSPTRRLRRGRAKTLLLLLLAALSALGALAWILRATSPASSGAAGPRPSATVEPVATQSPALRHVIGGDPAPAGPVERIPRERRPRSDASVRFSGSGTLEGRLNLPAGVAPPRVWTLVLAPSPVLVGGERVRARRVDFENGEVEFSLSDLPLGGYEVWAEAAGMSGRHEHLLLARPDALLVYQDLRLVPLAFVAGRVVDADGVRVGGLPVFLRPDGGGPILTQLTDASGDFRFERVPDGEYLLETGFADASLSAPRALDVRSPSLHLPALEVPLLHELAVTVLDADGEPLAGVRVRGWCDRGGRVDALTDAQGIARATWLPAGRLTLDAAHPERLQAGHARVHLDFPPADGEPLRIRLQR